MVLQRHYPINNPEKSPRPAVAAEEGSHAALPGMALQPGTLPHAGAAGLSPDGHGGRKKALDVNVGSSCALGHGGEIDGRTRPQASALPAANVAKTLFFYQIFPFCAFCIIYGQLYRLKHHLR